MKIDVNLSILSDKRLDTVIDLLTTIGEKMATAQQVFDAALAQQDIIAEGVLKVTGLVNEVKQLLEMGDPAGAQVVLDKIAATNQIMLDGFQDLEAVTDEVDAVNG
jgi:hypothetical protein